MSELFPRCTQRVPTDKLLFTLCRQEFRFLINCLSVNVHFLSFHLFLSSLQSQFVTGWSSKDLRTGKTLLSPFCPLEGSTGFNRGILTEVSGAIQVQTLNVNKPILKQFCEQF